VDAVGADHDVGVSGRAVLELHLYAIRILGQADASMVKMKDAVGHRRGENVEQFGAMEIVIWRAEVSLACVGQGLARDYAAVVPAVDDDRARAHSEAAERLLESESMEDSRRVRTYLDAGADFAEFGGLFEDLNFKARASKRQCGGEAADPGADYDDSHVLSLDLGKRAGQWAVYGCCVIR
jgi:hypothetical protein